MKNTMEYKGYIGSVEFSEEDCILYGKVMGIGNSLLNFLRRWNSKRITRGFSRSCRRLPYIVQRMKDSYQKIGN